MPISNHPAKLKLRVADIKSAVIPIDTAQKDYHFESPRGLTLRVTSAGKRSFYVLARMRGGKMIRQKIGDFPSITPEQAKIRALDLLAKISAGEDPTEERRVLRGSETLLIVFEQFLKNRRSKRGAQLSQRTQADYRDVFTRHCSSIANKRLLEISSDDISRIYHNVGKRSGAGANKTRAMLSSVFAWAVKSKKVGVNPVTFVGKAFVEESRDRFMGSDELRRFFAALNTISSDLRDFFLICLFTGVRRSNVQAMAWSDIDVEGAIWRISNTKNGTPQNVTLSPECLVVLRGLEKRVINRLPNDLVKIGDDAKAQRSSYVFPGTGKTGHLVEPKKSWATLLKNAELHDLRIHDLRRTLGSWQAMTGASLSIIGKSLNQKSIEATKIYARLSLEPVRQSVQTATDAMLSAAGLKSYNSDSSREGL